MINEKALAFIGRFPLLQPTLAALNQAGIRWMIGGSGSLFLLGNDRAPDDVDIFLMDEDHDRADQLFGIESYTYRSDTELVRNSNPEGNHSMQLTSHLTLTIEQQVYDLRVTSAQLERRIKIPAENLDLWLMPPEDVLLIKALLRRGPEVGKHDLQDIQHFVDIFHVLDHTYLAVRIEELHAAGRVGNTFGQMN